MTAVMAEVSTARRGLSRAKAEQGWARLSSGHLTIDVGSGFTALAFLAIRDYLRDAGEERWSVLAQPFIVMGSTLFAILPGMEFAALAAAETSGDVEAAQTSLFPWFVPILLTGGISFVLGVLGFARGIADSHVLRPQLTRLVVAALVVMAARASSHWARSSSTCRARPAS
jgi:cytochrome bd-type quinol oxidase subunit 2